MLTLRLFISFALLLFAGYANAANVCVGPTATGSGSGADWSNQAAWSSLTFVRGNTYYLADGTGYAALTLSTALSGTQWIYIKKATASDHGTNTGWSSAYGDGQAVMGKLTFNTGYWEINGQTRDEDNWKDDTAYGIKIQTTGGSGTRNIVINDVPASYFTFKYLCLTGAGTTDTTQVGTSIYSVGYASANWHYYLTIERNLFRYNAVPYLSRGNFNVSFRYNYVDTNWDIAGGHQEAISHTRGDDWEIAYNTFESVMDTGVIVILNAGTAYNHYRWKIHGNIFWHDPNRSGLEFWGVGNGVLAVINSNTATDFGFHNNTIVNYHRSHTASSGSVGIRYDNQSGCTASNNVWYLLPDNYYASGPVTVSLAGSHSYNWFYFQNGASYPTESTGRLIGTSDPFVNWDGGNFNLAYAIPGTASLGSPYNVDRNGVTRGSDGVWDRGALEYGGTGDPDLDPSIGIDTPTTDPNYTTTDETKTISGWGYDDLGISSVTYACPTCTPTSGTATGTTAWSISSLGLALGANVITVTITDSGTQTAQDVITITRNSGADTTAPVISNILPTGTITYSSTTTLSCDTDETATCKYDVSKAFYPDMTYSMTASVNHHTATSPELSPLTPYTYWIRCMDSAGNTSAASEVSFTTGPQTPDSGQIGITGGGSLAVGLTSGSLTISW